MDGAFNAGHVDAIMEIVTPGTGPHAAALMAPGRDSLPGTDR
jgi:hypothetical protein